MQSVRLITLYVCLSVHSSLEKKEKKDQCMSFQGGIELVRSLSAKYGPDRYKRDKSAKFGTELH